ncbi:tyrosine--tRNA ligase [Flavonifractor plautii]|nr:tyrosine--tRNA ligase [Flavonifractor plautii]
MTCYEELKARGLIAQVTNEEEISKMINEGKAVFYIGFDPTADSLHVGHFMALCLMKRLQMAGNRPIALIGGGTGMVGDPSGRTDMRSMMTVETIQHNCACFKKQMERFIEFGDGKAQMVNNADWLMDLNYVELLREVGACFSVNNMLRAECYKQRMEKGLSFLEFNYMIMQSYDFYHLFQHYGCNMQFGGDDQWSNMLGGTELIRRKLGKDAHAMTITLLLNSEGKKMGKTAKGAVWLDPNKTSPYEFYQYWRNVGDSDVLKCLRMLTFLPIEQIDEMDKWEGAQLNQAKEILAFELTKLVHGEEEAQKAQDAAKALFAQGGDKSNVPTTTLDTGDLTDGAIGVLELMLKCGLVPSKKEARRLVEQGGVELDGQKVTDVAAAVTAEQLSGEGIMLKKGKRSSTVRCSVNEKKAPEDNSPPAPFFGCGSDWIMIQS